MGAGAAGLLDNPTAPDLFKGSEFFRPPVRPAVRHVYGVREAIMVPTREIRLDRIRACVSDLSQNGIDIEQADDRRLDRVVREHIDYFQLMLGYDTDPSEVLDLLRERSGRAS